MRRRVRYRGERVEKRYRREALLTDDAALKTRLRLIEEVSAEHPTVPATSFRWEDDALILEQTRIRPQPLTEPGDPLMLDALQGLAILLDTLSPVIVHGDVVRKNLVFDGAHLHLVDWEPALRQIRNGRPTLLYTEPYLSLRDRADGTLSTETDKLGFFFAAHRLLHGKSPLPALGALVTARRQERRCITPIPEEAFMNRSFGELLDLAEDSEHWTA